MKNSAYAQLTIITYFNPITRYEELAKFYHAHDWDDEARWTDRQLAKAK